jgi:DNA repair proteins
MTGVEIGEDGIAEAARALGTSAVVAAAWLGRVGGVRAVPALEPRVWQEAPGVGPRLAARLSAAARLWAVAVRHGPVDAPVFDTPAAAVARLGPALQGLAHEQLHALYLDRRQRVLAHRRLRWAATGSRSPPRPTFPAGG